MRRLYRPDKYRVVQGNGSDGLCTAWSDVGILLSNHPEIRDRFALIGTLYSREGVSVIIRNLALNPDIRRLYLWASSGLSRTEHGRRGWEALREVWRGDFGVLDGGIDRNVAKLIISNVELVDVSDIPPESLSSLPPGRKGKYMEPVEFPDAAADSGKPFPSEEVGFLVRAGRMVDAWARVVDRIMRYGRIKGTEYGMKQKELSAVMWIFDERIEDFEEPEWTKRLRESTGLEGWKEYAKLMTSPSKDEKVAYTYGNRLREFFGVDQLEWVAEKLARNPETRRAVCVTYYPPADEHSSSPPCLNWMQFIERDGKLDMFAIFRSHDIFKAGLSNALGLMEIHRIVADKAGMGRGVVAITSYSAHIYEQDWGDAERVAECMVRARPKLWFDAQEDEDPRGNMIITVSGGRIVAELVAGDRRIEIIGKTAKEVAYRIARLDLLSSGLHYIDIGMELQKAEHALRLGIPYVQDRPLDLSGLAGKGGKDGDGREED